MDKEKSKKKTEDENMKYGIKLKWCVHLLDDMTEREGKKGALKI